jgi:anti-anti-sigma factor
MHFETKKNGKAMVLKLKEKRLDAAIAPELKGEFMILCTPQTRELVIDLADVEFCDSSGLSALLIAERKMREHGGVVKLVGLHKKVFALIKISHLDRAFQMFSSVPKALAKA